MMFHVQELCLFHCIKSVVQSDCYVLKVIKESSLICVHKVCVSVCKWAMYCCSILSTWMAYHSMEFGLCCPLSKN